MNIDLLRREIARSGIERFLRKEASFGPAVLAGTAFQTPAAAMRARARHEAALQLLDNAGRTPLGGGEKNADFMTSLLAGLVGGKAQGNPPTGADYGGAAIGQVGGGALKGLGAGLTGGIGDHLRDWIGPDKALGERRAPMSMFASKALEGAGSEAGKAGIGILKGLAGSAMGAVTAIGDNRARQAILQQLKAEDPVIAQADDKLLMEAYQTMVRFAPTLSTDKNAVRNFLREAVLTGSGPNFATIKLLGETERTITGQGGKKE